MHVVSPTEVRLISSLVGVELQRHVFAIATPVLPASLESVFSPEEFIIALHTRCVQSEDRDYLIALASDVRAGSEVAASDDGLSQTISGKSGVTLMRAQTVKNPVHLAPYRTFPEVSQPASAFIVRAKKGSGEGSPVNFTLIEADGGAWRLEAVNAIARWLDEHGVELPVLV